MPEQTSRPTGCKTHWSPDALYAYFERWLLSIEELNRERFAANREAVSKAEDAQKAYNAQHNDLTRKMESQAAQFVNREKLDDMVKGFDAQLEAIKKAVALLEAGLLAGGVRRETVRENRQTVQWTVGQFIAVALGLLGFAVAVFEMLRHSVNP